MNARVTDKYKIIKEIGKGAYGQVYLAKHQQLDQKKAIKELKPKNRAEKARVSREVELLQQAQHPHVIKIDEVFTSQESTYICMEYAEGGSLEKKLEHHVRKDESIQITLEMLRGVQALHARGIIHRDLKPGNILFNEQGKVKIGDFGIAKTNINISKLTKTGESLGTIGYMAPEQLVGKKYEVDEQSDVYAVGVMLYEMLTSEHPFRGENELETVNRALGEKYRILLEEYNIDKELQYICYKSINKNKLRRYKNASEMLEELNIYFLRNNDKKKKRNYLLLSKNLKEICYGIVGGILMTGMSLHMIAGENDTKTEWKKYSKEYQELTRNPQSKDFRAFKLRQKDIQRNMYNKLQEGSEESITEKVLKGEELYKLGMIYYKGKGVEKDYTIAFKYFEKASRYQLIKAYLKLGGLYRYGKGVEKNKAKAIEYYTKVAKNKDPRGYHNLAEMYIGGKVVDEKGVEYLERAAEMNYEKSIEILVEAYENSGNDKKSFKYIKKGVVLENAYCLSKFGIGLIVGKYGLEKNEKKGIEYIKKAILYGDVVEILSLFKYREVSKKKEKIFREIFMFLEDKKENNKPQYLTSLGYMYQKGIGTQKDYIKAKEMYEKAAALGNTTAMSNLGTLYQNGLGVKKDYKKAKKILEEATNKGNFAAMANLGILYQKGYGVKKDYRKAKKWYEEAIFMGNSDALSNLAVLYQKGYGVKQDYVKAKELLEEAARKGSSNAITNLGIFYEFGYGVKRDYRKAKELYEQAVNKGNMYAMKNLGFLYEKGGGVDKDYIKARELYEESGKLGNPEAIRNLGTLYYLGKGVSKSYRQAKLRYEQAGSLGDGHAFTNIGLMYQYGHGVQKSYLKAKEFFEKGIILGDSHAILGLGLMYENGYGIKKNYNKARKLYEEAARMSNKKAIYNLGVLYYNGKGVKRNYDKAIELFKQAALLGDETAINYLRSIGYRIQVNKK